VLDGEAAAPRDPQSAVAGLKTRGNLFLGRLSGEKVALKAGSCAMDGRETGQGGNPAALSVAVHVRQVLLAGAGCFPAPYGGGGGEGTASFSRGASRGDGQGLTRRSRNQSGVPESSRGGTTEDTEDTETGEGRLRRPQARWTPAGPRGLGRFAGLARSDPDGRDPHGSRPSVSVLAPGVLASHSLDNRRMETDDVPVSGPYPSTSLGGVSLHTRPGERGAGRRTRGRRTRGPP